MADHTTAGRARAFEFTFSAHADSEPERLRFVIGDGYGFERLHGHDRMGAVRWVHHSLDEQDFDAVVRALLIECAVVPSDIEQLRARAERAERERDEARVAVGELEADALRLLAVVVPGATVVPIGNCFVGVTADGLGLGQAWASKVRAALSAISNCVRCPATRAEPGEAERWRDAPSLWEAPDGSRFQCARCRRVVSATVGGGGEFEGVCARCWCVVSGETSQPVADPLAGPALDSDEDGGWHEGDDMPDLGAWVEVEVVDGQVLNGEVAELKEEQGMIEIRGDAAVPEGGSRNGVWATWPERDWCAENETRARWRYIPRPSEPDPVEPLLDDEWADDGSLDVQADIDAESRAADGDGWLVEGLPPLGACVDVLVESGEIYTGEVTDASDSHAHIRLRGDASGPYAGSDDDEWSTWGSVPAERRRGWRLAKRPSSKQPVEVAPEPEAEQLPEGWRWDDAGWAVGPDFVDRDGDAMPRMVWISGGRLNYQGDRDEEPLAVVRAVIARHDRLARERGQ